jgi:starch synthase
LYNNNHEKFAFFAKVVLESLHKLFWYPDLIVCNDWQMSFLPIIFKNLYKDKIEQFKNTKIISMIHSYDDLYKFPNSLFKSLGIDYNSKKKSQNTLELAFEYSDFVYVFDDGDLLKKISKNKNVSPFLTKKSKCKIIDVKDLDFSEKIEMYNSLKEHLHSISKK